MNNVNHVTQLRCTYTTVLVITTVTIFSIFTKSTIDDNGSIVSEVCTEICNVNVDTEEIVSSEFTIQDQPKNIECQAPHPVINGDFTVMSDRQFRYALSSNYNPLNTYTWSVIGSANIIAGQGSNQVEVEFTEYDAKNVILRIVEETPTGSCSAISVVVIDVDGQFLVA